MATRFAGYLNLLKTIHLNVLQNFFLINFRLCIQSNNDKCPIDNNICQLKLVNRVIIEQINEIQVHCIFAFAENSNEDFVIDPNGCKETVPYTKKR